MQWHRQLLLKPKELRWRIAALFMSGAFLFALGSFPVYAQNVDPGTVAITFVVGSVLFTAAAYSLFLDVINGSRTTDQPGRFRFWAWSSGDMMWSATAVQLGGTLFFNFSTIDAMIESLSIEQTNHLVWAPDLFGSIAFLIASHLAWLCVCGRRWCVRTDDDEWWISALNYVGSFFFMAAAIASFTLETTGETLNLTIVNIATFLGASCFFVGAYLLLPAFSTPSTSQEP